MLANGANCNFLQYLVDWRIKQYRNENFLANSNVRLKCSAFITSHNHNIESGGFFIFIFILIINANF